MHRGSIVYEMPKAALGSPAAVVFFEAPKRNRTESASVESHVSGCVVRRCFTILYIGKGGQEATGTKQGQNPKKS